MVGRRRRATYGIVKVVAAAAAAAASSKTKKQKQKTSGNNKNKNNACTISANLAKNLSLRQDDKLKVIPFLQPEQQEKSEDDEAVSYHHQRRHRRSGDLQLVHQAKPATVQSVTLSPIQDSLISLQAQETAGDDIPDEELQARFVQPYLLDDHNSSKKKKAAVIKQGHILTLRDENGKQLEFVVSHVELAKEEDAKGDDDEEEDVPGMSCCSE